MFKNHLIVTAACVVALVSGTCAEAAPAKPVPAAATPTVAAATVASEAPAGARESKTYGDWSVRCFAVKSPVQCDVYQAAVEKETQRRIVSISIAYAPAANVYVAKFIVPLGTKIQEGLVIQTDKMTNKPLLYSRCEQDGCYVEGPLDRTMVERLSSAKRAAIIVATYGGPKITLPVSLNGLAEALGAMKAMAAQRSAQSGQAVGRR